MIDLFPRDHESGCYADMTRTFVIGEPSDELREWHRLCKEALDSALDDIRAGVTGSSVFDGTCDVFEAAGYKTQRTKEEGKPLEERVLPLARTRRRARGARGAVARAARHRTLVAGDVVSVEPGLYRRGCRRLRLEDLVLVTENGCENLTDYPYDLEP